MHDIRAIRDDADAFDSGLSRRGLAPESPRLLAMDERRKAIIGELQAAQETRNVRSKEIGKAKATKDEALAQTLMAEVAALKERIPALEDELRGVEKELSDALAAIPNIPASEVPDGADEHGNVEKSRFGTPREIPDAQQHFEIGEAIGLMDFETAAKLSGSRFVVLKGQLARLERALGQFMLDLHTTEHGYLEVNPPLLVKDDAMFGTAQLPKFRDDQFAATGDFWLIPTAEVPLTNLVRESILSEEELPLRFTALTPCFRAEAGSAGRDTRGMLRQHQFTKCELVSITAPEKSAEEHERMLACAEEVLQKLEIPYRVMTLCTGDMGFASRKTYDIEAWLPGQKTYREISSCSVCGDFQARRMNARFRRDGRPHFVHTLNGSGVAVGRALIAVLENYQNADGSVTIPSALAPYMGGVTRIERPA
ncbi:MAG: serine--tRNA ligase [Microvirga sp.]|nr:serine--tRNA ligase [Microvirga sp.]